MGPVGSSLTPGSVTSRRIASPSVSFSRVCGCTWLAGRRRRATVSTHCGTGPSLACTATPREASRGGFRRAFCLARRCVSPTGSTCSFAAALMTWAAGAPRTPRRAHPETRNFPPRTFCGQRTTGGSPRRTWTPTSPGWAGLGGSSTRSSQIRSSTPSAFTATERPTKSRRRVLTEHRRFPSTAACLHCWRQKRMAAARTRSIGGVGGLTPSSSDDRMPYAEGSTNPRTLTTRAALGRIALFWARTTCAVWPEDGSAKTSCQSRSENTARECDSVPMQPCTWRSITDKFPGRPQAPASTRASRGYERIGQSSCW